MSEECQTNIANSSKAVRPTKFQLQLRVLCEIRLLVRNVGNPDVVTGSTLRRDPG
jgi:hypothetical protein